MTSIQTLLFIEKIGCIKKVITPKAETITFRNLLQLMTNNLPLKFRAQFPMDYLDDNAATYPGLEILSVPTKAIQDSNIELDKINHLFNTYAKPAGTQIIYLTSSLADYNADYAVLFIFDSIGTTETGKVLYNSLQVDQTHCCWQSTNGTNTYLMADDYSVLNGRKWKAECMLICGEYGIDANKGIIYKLKNQKWKSICKIQNIKAYHSQFNIPDHIQVRNFYIYIYLLLNPFTFCFNHYLYQI